MYLSSTFHINLFDFGKILDVNGLAPIHFQAENGELEALKCITDGESVNMKSGTGTTPLAHACMKVHLIRIPFTNAHCY